MLQDKGILLLNPTQNIDNLEQKTGMDMKQVI
jgi:NAD-dependent SIR2 family protein deacetylase